MTKFEFRVHRNENTKNTGAIVQNWYSKTILEIAKEKVLQASFHLKKTIKT